MAYPILAASSTWYKGTATRSTITEINIVDSYTPTGNEAESWNADVGNTGSIKCYRTGTVLTIAGNGSGKIAMNGNSSFVFSDSNKTDYFGNLSTINGAEILDTSSATTFANMFLYCQKLTYINVSNWDTRNVTDMYGVFQVNSSLTTLDVSNWIVDNVTDMLAMFSNCSSITALDVSNWNVDGVTNMRLMFANCASLTTLDVSNWNVSNVTNMSSMFNGCTSLKTLDVSNWNVGKVTDMLAMFQYCPLTALDVSDWNVGNVTTMEFMFNNCTSLKTLDVSSWDVSKVTNMRAMFQQCQALNKLDVLNWNVSNVTDMCFMLYGTKNIGAINVSKWDVSKVETFHHFTAHAYITLIGVENWDVSSCRAFNAMFHTCRNTSLDLSKWDVSKGVTFAQMFEYSSKLVEIKGLEDWDTSNGKDFAEMFSGCKSLKKLDLSSFDTRNASTSWTDEWNKQKGDMKDMFLDMNSLERITFGENFSFKGNGSCTAAVLPTPSSTYINGADGSWYDLDGTAYAPTAISEGANTYYASIDVIDIVYLIKHATLIKLAKAVRSLTGGTEKMTLDEMKTALENLV